jgi:gamma-glutamylcyclotransferase (GGCT)/AIG2-like uncharacterized protein YtfP
MTEQLFVYGTLKEPRVQFLVFGRVTPGELDTLTGYRKASIRLGGRVFPIIKPEAGTSVEGMVITVSPAELKQIDHYEGKAYQRKRVTLTSGRQAWVYQAWR